MTTEAEAPETVEQVSEQAETVVAETDTAGFNAAEAQANAILDALLNRIGDVTKQDPWLKLYVYGSPGAGKTVFSATTPAWLLYNIERGGKVLKGHRDLIGPNCESLQYTSSVQARMIVKYLKEKHPAFDKYETFIVDSASQLQEKYNKEVIAEAIAQDPHWNPTEMPDNGYMRSTQFMKDFFDDIRNLDRHVIVTGHAREDVDKATDRRLIRPNLTPKVTEAMAGIFDAVIYMERFEAEGDTPESRIMRVHPVTKPVNIMAKTRITGLDPLLLNPTFDTFLSAYNK